MANINMQTPPPCQSTSDTPYQSPSVPARKRKFDDDDLLSPRLFELSPGFSTVPSYDPFADDHAPTLIRHGRERSLDQFIKSLTLPSPISTPEAASVFNNPTYSISEPSTWPIVFLPYHNTPGVSAPSHINEMLCHVHYQGHGARVLYWMIFNEINASQTDEEKTMIEFSAYLSWPFNCTREGWRVYSGMTDHEILEWKQAMREWQDGNMTLTQLGDAGDSMEIMGSKDADEDKAIWKGEEKQKPVPWPRLKA